MPRFIPKWLSIFPALLMGAVLFTGCGTGNDSHPAKDSDAKLSSLVVSAGGLTPAFDPAVTTYAMTVTAAVTSTTVTPTLHSAKATVTVNGVAVPSGTASASIPLATGANAIPVVVKAENDTTQTYTITITRGQDTNNTLSNLALSVGTLMPTFDPSVTDYVVALTTDTSALTAISNWYTLYL